MKDEFFDTPSKHGHIFESLVGEKFSRLLVVKLVGRRIYGKRTTGTALWECLCDCGVIKNITSSALKNKKARSCGCFLTEYRKINVRKKFKAGQAPLTQICLSYEAAAKKRNLQFDLSRKDIESLINKNCFYCGIKPSNIKKGKLGNIFYNGIDRVNNQIGYTCENSVPCCKTCNRAKLEQTKIEFLSWIEKVYTHNFGDKNV